MAKILPLYSPEESYQRHIARANRNIFKKVLDEISGMTPEHLYPDTKHPLP